jgi:hypothetical protein
MPSATRGLDRRRDVLDVLVSEQAVLAGVRVEAAHRDPRRESRNLRSVVVGQADHLAHPVGAHPLDRFAQRARGC